MATPDYKYLNVNKKIKTGLAAATNIIYLINFASVYHFVNQPLITLLLSSLNFVFFAINYVKCDMFNFTYGKQIKHSISPSKHLLGIPNSYKLSLVLPTENPVLLRKELHDIQLS